MRLQENKIKELFKIVVYDNNKIEVFENGHNMYGVIKINFSAVVGEPAHVKIEKYAIKPYNQAVEPRKASSKVNSQDNN